MPASSTSIFLLITSSSESASFFIFLAAFRDGFLSASMMLISVVNFGLFGDFLATRLQPSFSSVPGFAARLVRGESDATPDPVMGLDADEKHEKQEIPGAILAPLVLGDVFGDFDAS